jgi:rhodanese-related sulfurtransferase
MMMKTASRGWSRNRILGGTALLLGIVALIGEPYQGHVVRIDTKELATIVETRVDHVTTHELADWIIKGNTEYRLIDVRDEQAYAEYHIPSAEHVPIADLPEYPLLRNEKIVLYSDGGIHSAQAWFLLKAARYPGAYILLGGLDAWVDEILFPALPEQPTAEQAAEFERVRFVSEFFGGSARAGAEEPGDRAALPLPKVDNSKTPKTFTRKKKKKKGC